MAFATAQFGRRPTSIRSDRLAYLRSLPHCSARATATAATAFVAHQSASSAPSSRSVKYSTIHSSQRTLPLERPPDPSSFSSSNEKDQMNDDYVQRQARLLRQWMRGKQAIVCLTGAGLSTESGIPDYRGVRGSYFRGHKPVIHHEFMSSRKQRQRYWARSLVGYSPFANAKPNLGHEALARLEERKVIGVNLEGCAGFALLGDSCFGNPPNVGREKGKTGRVSVITQNVDTLQSKAGVKHCLHLHGRGDLVRCMNCGATHNRQYYHDQLTELNREWLDKARAEKNSTEDKASELRPDGDAELGNVSYDEFILPPCPRCRIKHRSSNGDHEEEQQSFFKTDVTFFGDSVPKHRFDVSYAAIDAADGVVCIGTSLAVHSAFRLARRALERGTPVAILNVGKTRIEKERLGDGLVTKIESPIGETLSEVVRILDQEG